jgi:acyl transferase domain-containing protein/acyl carrier protein
MRNGESSIMNTTGLREIETVLCGEVARLLECDIGAVDPNSSLGELGLDSLGYVNFAAFGAARFNVSIKPDLLFEHHSIRQTAAYIAGEQGQAASPASPPDTETANPPAPPELRAADIAIVGVALRLPGARNMDELAERVESGACALGDVPQGRWMDADAWPAPLKAGLVEDVDRFDAAFFNISPREAMAMDPQQRLLMECAWHAFEDAGYGPARLSGSATGVFIGASSFDYYELLLKTGAGRLSHIGTGISHAILANRLSQYFNLRGASETIDTACSSSLVALWRGVDALRRGEIGLALVGGANILASPTPFKIFAEAGMLSPAGRCLPFDAEASGYVRGEGVACIVLKSARAAVADGDRILALIKGGAVGHGGRTQSLTAPSPEAQSEVIVAALEDAEAEPESIGYIEAHGTGTSLGDPIEFRGLKKAYAQFHAKRGRAAPAPHACIGSIKAQIGHLEAAAGMAGVLKALVCLQRRIIPANAHLGRLNPLIELEDSGFRIPVSGGAWDGEIDGADLSRRPRRAGVSSFGFGGTNAHVILEEAPEPPSRRAEPGMRLFLLSARRPEALRQLSTEIAKQLRGLRFEEADSEPAYLDDLAYTLRRARGDAIHRLAIIAQDRGDLADKLERHGRSEDEAPEIMTGEAGRDPVEFQGPVGDWRAAARAWVRGAAVDWLQIVPRGQARMVALPAHPFAGESFWPTLRAVPTPAEDESAEPFAFWTSQWEPAPLPNESRTLLEGGVSVFVSGEQGLALAAALSRELPRNPVRVLRYPSAGEDSEDAAPLAAWIDLCALDEDDGANLLAARRLESIRRRLGGALKRGEPLRIVQATAGLQDLGAYGQPPASLAGAAVSAVYESLGAEYRRCLSKSVDFAGAESEAAPRAACLIKELQCTDGHTAVAYLGGQRLVRTLARTALPPASLAAGLAGDVALITGGTGAIGLELARSLAEQGFRALLLTGRQTPGAAQQAVLRAIGNRGVAVSLYRGELDDAEALASALASFRAAHGPVTHVFHCAGAADTATPAFYQKTADSMERVFAPKVRALSVLHRLFADTPPKAFVLFSSVSAVIPRLAAGALDYAAANRYLDLFAQYRRAHGDGYYMSIDWTRWRNLGLARHTQEVQGAASPLDGARCLAALFRILAAGEAKPAWCVLASGDRPDTRLSPPRPAVSGVSPQAGGGAGEPAPAHRAALRAKLRTLVARELETVEAKLDDQASFEQLGIDSIVLMGLITAIEKWLGHEIDPEALIRCDSIDAVAGYLAERFPATPADGGTDAATVGDPAAPASAAPTDAPLTLPARMTEGGRGASQRVAVIGMACRFPGAPDRESFWRNLEAGVDSVSPVPPSRFDAERLLGEGRILSRWGGFIENIEQVYPKLFGMNAEEAADVDPLVRLFTECGLAALADAPAGVEGLRGRRVGVFAGARTGRYAERIAAPGKRSITGVGQNFVAAYVSHLLDLRGPALVVDSACSSSLAAIHLACQSLRNGDSDVALAGGVEVLLDEKPYLFLSASHALSPDGRCRPFSAQANGFVPGEGVGCVVLKPLERALADADPIYAVIEGGAMNNDGHTLGITTPGSEGQTDAITRALDNAGVRPRDISYVETHGTGTLIGDPIELQSLARAFQSEPPARCAVGSVKSNVGHLLSAAGIASFIKVALALHHRVLPPTLHCEQVNPRFEFERTPFYPIRRAASWESGAAPRRAGISAFGFGKTNVHLILAERPEQAPAPRPKAEAGLPPFLAGEPVHAWHAAPAASSDGPETDYPLLVLDEIVMDGVPVLAVENGAHA